MKKTLLVTLAILFSLASFCYALETDTHEYINEYIARNTINGFSLDSYLRNQLNIEEGIKDIFNSKYVWWWLSKGGKYEDKPPWCIPYWRSLRHFHNPLTDKSLEGILESSIQWSQKPAGTQSCGHYSWDDVRGYFLKALTSQTKSDRDENFAETFRGLGQLMHLVQDLSVPAHTRDDIHPLYNYETWALEILDYEKISGYDPISFDPSAIGNTNPLASVPFANLFDTNQYVEPNPDPSVTLRADIGLSEYTNANFFSLDTIFKDFPYPKSSSVQEVDYEIQDPRDPSNMVFRQYYKKVTHGDTGYRLATVPFLMDYVIDEPVYAPASLDKYVYNDYAERLIPRAVGYSTGLVNYFFRGKLEAEFVDGDLKITNKSEETMHDGHFELYYDNEAGERQEIEIYSGAEVTTLTPNGNQTITFDPPGDPTSYVLVYKGGLGNENDAVVGKVKPRESIHILVSLIGKFEPVGGGSIIDGEKYAFLWDPEKNEYAKGVYREVGGQLEEITDDDWPVPYSDLSYFFSIHEELTLKPLFDVSAESSGYPCYDELASCISPHRHCLVNSPTTSKTCTGSFDIPDGPSGNCYFLCNVVTTPFPDPGYPKESSVHHVYDYDWTWYKKLVSRTNIPAVSFIGQNVGYQRDQYRWRESGMNSKETGWTNAELSIDFRNPLQVLNLRASTLSTAFRSLSWWHHRDYDDWSTEVKSDTDVSKYLFKTHFRDEGIVQPMIQIYLTLVTYNDYSRECRYWDGHNWECIYHYQRSSYEWSAAAACDVYDDAMEEDPTQQTLNSEFTVAVGNLLTGMCLKQGYDPDDYTLLLLYSNYLGIQAYGQM